MEIFLDRMAWRAATTRGGSERFLLDRRYDAMPRPDAEVELRHRLRELEADVGPELRGTAAWRTVQAALQSLGAMPRRR